MMQKKRKMEDAPPEANALAKEIFRRQGRAFLTVTRVSYASQGRGAIVVHTTKGHLNEIHYVAAEAVKILLEKLHIDSPDALALMDSYNPEIEFVVVCFDNIPTDDGGVTDFAAGMVTRGQMTVQ